MDKPVDLPAPPHAEQHPYSYERHGVTVEDPWHWIRDPQYPEVTDAEVLAYLTAENDYFGVWAKQNQPLMDQLFEEMKGRIKEDDSSVPMRDGDFLYWWAFKPGAQYRTWYRKPVGGGDDQIIFDEPAEAEGKEYFRLGAIEPSPDGKLLATLVDDNGSERFHLRVRELATGKDIETVTEVGIGSPVWTSDSAGIVFTEVNEHWRSYRARYQRLGARADDAITLYEEREELGFSVGAHKSHDKSLIFIATGDNATSEVRFVSADDPSQPLTLISRRKPTREYHVDAAHGKLWILTNDDHVNFRLAEADPANPEEWRTVDCRVGSRLSDRGDALSRSFGDQQPCRWARSACPAHLRRRGDAHSVQGGELHRFLLRQPRFCAGELSRRLFLNGYTDNDIRLSSGDRRARGSQGAGNPVGIRWFAIRDRAADDHRARWRKGPGLSRLSP